MNVKYTHLELNKEIFCVAGYYTPQKEVRLSYNNREVLYVVGRSVIESSCCGATSFGYVLVPGYLISWQKERNKAGLPVSEVEATSDKAAQDNIRQIIEKAEHISHIEFW